MMARPVAEVLVCFGSPAPLETIEEARAEPRGFSPPSPAGVEEGALLIEFSHDEDHVEAAAEGLARACAEHAAALDREKVLFESRLSNARIAWTQEEGARLNEKITLALAEIEAEIARGAARLLRAFLPDLLRRKVIEQLAREVGVLLGGKDHPLIKISGAEDLLGALRDKLSKFSAVIEYAPDGSIDVEVVADQTIIDSRLEAWIEWIKALPE